MTPMTREAVSHEVLEHMVGALHAAALDDTPFTHFQAEASFPREIYGEMLDRLPEMSAFMPYQPGKYTRPDGTVARMALPLETINLSRFAPHQRELWAGVMDALKAARLRETLFDMLAPDICRRYETDRDHLRSLAVHPWVVLLRDRSGYWIEPHQDLRSPPTKVMSVQFYLPRDASQADLGTTLYRRAAERKADAKGDAESDAAASEFEKVKQMAFVPNSAYGFAVSEASWHGREPVPDGARDRDSILLFYCEEPCYWG
jgi:hypothetical protein